MSLPIVLEIRARREQNQFCFVLFFKCFTPCLRGWRSRASISMSLTTIAGIRAGHEHRQWVTKSRIYFYVTDDGSGNWGWA